MVYVISHAKLDSQTVTEYFQTGVKLNYPKTRTIVVNVGSLATSQMPNQFVIMVFALLQTARLDIWIVMERASMDAKSIILMIRIIVEPVTMFAPVSMDLLSVLKVNALLIVMPTIRIVTVLATMDAK